MHEYDMCLPLHFCITALDHVQELIYIFYHTSSTMHNLGSIFFYAEGIINKHTKPES